MLNEDVGAGGDNSAAQRDLSAFLSGSAAAFAHTGDSSVSPGRVLTNWPIAYSDQSKQARAKAHSEQMNVYIVGRPEKSGPARTRGSILKGLRSDNKFWRQSSYSSGATSSTQFKLRLVYKVVT